MRSAFARTALGALAVAVLAAALMFAVVAARSGAAPRRAATYRFAVWGDVRPASTGWPTAQSLGFRHVVGSLARQSLCGQHHGG